MYVRLLLLILVFSVSCSPWQPTVPVEIVIRPNFTDEDIALMLEAMTEWEQALGLGAVFRPVISDRKITRHRITIKNGRVSGGDEGRAEWKFNRCTITLDLERIKREVLPERRDNFLRKLTTHELGHCLGHWGHDPDPDSIMNGTVYSDPDDVQFITYEVMDYVRGKLLGF